MRGSSKFALVALAVFAGQLRAEDSREDRDRRARAALALTAPSAPKVAAAPAPKPKSVAYADGYKRASVEQQPLVVYVGCPVEPVPGAVVSWAGEFRDVKAPAVVVGYPVGDRLYVHATLPGCPPAKEVAAEVKSAAKKCDPKPMPPREVKDAPAPKPLDWQIRANEEPEGSCIFFGKSTAIKLGLIPADGSARTELDVLRDASVRVWCGDAGGSGTVVFAEPGRSVILTAAHVVEHGAPVTVRAEGRTLAAKVLLTDRAADLCALEVRRELPAVVSVSDEWAAGDEVLMVGGSSIWSKGKAREAARLNERPNMLADYESISGDSGGGVFVRGSLVAVHVGRIGDRARCPCRLTAFVAKALRAEPAHELSGNSGQLKPATAPVTLPASGGCVNGNCPAPSYAPARSGLFRRW